MKMKNIPPNIKSKSIKEAKDEINDILSKLEKNDAVLEDYNKDYQKLIKLKVVRSSIAEEILQLRLKYFQIMEIQNHQLYLRAHLQELTKLLN